LAAEIHQLAWAVAVELVAVPVVAHPTMPDPAAVARRVTPETAAMAVAHPPPPPADPVVVAVAVAGSTLLQAL
jgi:hypothetical protein